MSDPIKPLQTAPESLQPAKSVPLPAPVTYHNTLDYDTTRKQMFDGALGAMQTKYPIENEKYRLSLNDLRYEGPERFSLAEQKQALLKRKSLYRPIRGTWQLTDKTTNQPVDTFKSTIAHVPYLTPRGTYIINGSEYSVASQLRLKSGVYTRKKENGELESHFNVLKGGPSFRISMEPETGIFRMNVGQAKLKLYPILRAMGKSDQEIQESWGPQLFNANMTGDDKGTLDKIWERLADSRTKKEVGESGEKDFKKLFAKMELDPNVTKHTLGESHPIITPETLLRSTKKIMNVAKGTEDTDDRDSMAYQETWNAPDLLKERIEKDAGRLGSRLLWRATLRGNLSGLPSAALNPQIESLFFKSGVAQHLEEVSPLDPLDQNVRVTRMGEGGMSSDAIPEDSRSVQPSHFGFIDPVRSPECFCDVTEVMTDTGWKLWKDVTDSDRLACKINRCVRFELPLKLIKEYYEGPMIGCQAQGINFLVTPNHKLWSQLSSTQNKYGFELIKDIADDIPRYMEFNELELETDDNIEECGELRVRSSDMYEEPYKGTVYCAEVPGHLLYTRRNGSIGFWSGNSGAVGVDLRLSTDTYRGTDKQLYSKMMNVRTGKHQFITPSQAIDSVISFPGELAKARAEGRKHVRAMSSGRLGYVDASKVQYEAPSAQGMFSHTSNLVPFAEGMKPGRLLMAASHSRQALPLQDPEAPLVQSAGEDGKSYYDVLGNHMGIARSVTGGTVTAVTPDGIVVRDQKGQEHTHDLYNNFPLNRKTLINSTAVVKPGDVVQPGTLLAHSNFTNKNGTLAIGKNLRVAYVPWKGSVAADTHVLWYTADGTPVFDTINKVVPIQGLRSLATDPVSLDTAVIDVQGFSAHTADTVLNIRTSSGRQLRATRNHSFVTLDAQGRLVETAGSELTAKVSWIPRLAHVDLPVTVKDVSMVSLRRKSPLVLPLNYDLGFLCGLYAAEGCPSRTKIVFAVSDPVLRVYLLDCIRRVLGPRHVSVSATTVTLGEVRLTNWLVTQCGKGAANKQVAHVAFGAPRSFRLGFLAGFWVGDGRCAADASKPSDTDTLITSRKLRDGLGLLCASLDISTTHGEYKHSGYTHGVIYRLGICTKDTHKFPELPHTHKGARLKAIAESYRSKIPVDRIPIPTGVRSDYMSCARRRGITVYSRLQRQCTVGGTTSREDILQLIPVDTAVPGLRNLRQLALAPVSWDRIEECKPETYAGYVYDFDMTPLNTFICVDTLVVHNSNYEDGIVISESAAQKLKSEHMYTEKIDKEDFTTVGHSKFLSLFPSVYNKEQLSKIAANGIVKPGTIVNKNDPLILAVNERTSKGAGMLYHGGGGNWNDKSTKWEHETPGIVTDVWNDDDGVKLAVKTYAPCEVGDKLAPRHANKGVIASIIPDRQMPHDKAGKPFEALLNPLGLISRINPSQAFETVLGKIAEKRGVPYVIKSFSTPDLAEMVQAEMKKHDVSDTEDIIDPESGRVISKVLTGRQYVQKLHHTAESKTSERGLGAYSSEGVPAAGDEDSPKRIGLGEMQALISHGAIQNIQDIKNIKGTRNDDYWQAMTLGYTLPSPQMPAAYKKFMSLLQAAGINVKKKGEHLHLTAMTDKDVDAMSSGEIKDPTTVKWLTTYGRGLKGEKALDPVEGGLFDRGITGGHGGCFHASTHIATDQGPVTIGEIVNKKLGVNVLSYDWATKSVVFKPVVNWFRNTAPEGIGSSQFEQARTKTCEQLSSPNPRCLWGTRTHQVYTADGNKRDLESADYLLTHTEVLTDSQYQLVLGGLLGDGHIAPTGQYSERHCQRQKDYLFWKYGMLRTFCANPPKDAPTVHTYKGVNVRKPSWYFRTQAHDSFLKLRSQFYPVGKKIVYRPAVESLDALGLAVWYLDDGCISQTKSKNTKYITLSTHGFQLDDVQWLQQLLLRKWSLSSRIDQDTKRYAGKSYGYTLHIDGNSAQSFLDIVAPYIHPSMMYKLGRRPRTAKCKCGKEIWVGRVTCNTCLIEHVRNSGTHKLDKGVRRRRGGSLLAREIAAGLSSAPEEVTRCEQHDARVLLCGTALLNYICPTVQPRALVKVATTYNWHTGKKYERTRTVYDIEVQDTHNYFANNMLVSNSRWGHVVLTEPIPQPAMSDPIRRLLNLTNKDYEAVIAGQKELPGLGTGGTAIKAALQRIQIDPEIDRQKEIVKSAATGAVRDDAIKKLKYLQTFKKTEMKPEDLVITKVPVLPPQFRPITANSNFEMVAGSNLLYMDLMNANKNLKDISAITTGEPVNEARLNVYHALKAVTGLGDPIKPDRVQQGIKGVLHEIFGSSPKNGHVQRKLLGTSVDMSARSAITPNPDLNMDQIGIPEDQAWTLYGPFVTRRLIRQMGNEPSARAAAIRMVVNRDRTAAEALQAEMAVRPIMTSRAPALHRYSIMAFHPVLTKAKTLQISPAVTPGFNCDFDGNCCDFDTELIIRLSKSAIDTYAMLGYAFIDTQNNKGDCQMKVVNASVVTVGAGEASVYMKIGDFPRTGEPVKDKNGADVYSVPEGVSVLSYDFETGESVFKPVHNLTVEQDSPCVDIKAGSRMVTISTNESMCVFDYTTGALAKVTPAAALNKFVPVIVKDPTPFGTYGTRTLGWWVGAFLSDGWISGRTVGYAKADKTKRDEFVRIARSEIEENFTVYEYSHDDSDALGAGVKLHINGDLVTAIKSWGMSDEQPEGCRQALTKRIPMYMLAQGSEEFLWGMLSGLIDGDGSVYKNTTYAKSRFGARLSTSSPRLRDTFCTLLFRLGLQYSVTVTPPRNQSNEAYTISVSSEDLSQHIAKLICLGARERAIIEDWKLNPSSCNGMHDMIPLAIDEAVELRTYARSIKDNANYATLSKHKTEPKISRKCLSRVMSAAKGKISDACYKAVRIRIDSPVHWYTVDELTPTTNREVFDLAVEGTKIFAVNNGLIIYDTMNFHVLVTDKAIAEANEKMLPSKNLRGVKDFAPMWFPRHEFQHGLYLASTKRSGRKMLPQFGHERDVTAGFAQGKLNVEDIVNIKDKP